MTPLQILRKLRQTVSEKVTSYRCDKTINALIADVPTHQQLLYKTLLSNQLYWLMQQNMPDDTHQTYMALTKQIIGNILEIGGVVGIQPLSDPNGMIYHLRCANDGAPLEESPVPYTAPPLVIQVIHTAITSRTRKLPSEWPIIPLQPHSDVIRREMVNVMAKEISDDILSELLHRACVSANTNMPSVTPDTMVRAILDASRQIAFKTRRASGNVIITSPVGVSLLAMAGVVIHDDHNDDKPLYYTGSTKVGGVMFSVYVSTDPMFSGEHAEMFLVAYKSSVNEIDCGMIYSPYQVLLPRGPSIDPHTFEPRMTVFTRYSIQEYNDITFPTGNYYATVTVNVRAQEE